MMMTASSAACRMVAWMISLTCRSECERSSTRHRKRQRVDVPDSVIDAVALPGNGQSGDDSNHGGGYADDPAALDAAVLRGAALREVAPGSAARKAIANLAADLADSRDRQIAARAGRPPARRQRGRRIAART